VRDCFLNTLFARLALLVALHVLESFWDPYRTICYNLDRLGVAMSNSIKEVYRISRRTQIICPVVIDVLRIKPHTGTNVERSTLGLFLQRLYVYVSGSRLQPS